MLTERKGEHQELLQDLAAQGFVRVRIDGRIHELDALPVLDAKKRHTIEAVVDRMRVRPDGAQRLAESFETALRLSGDSRGSPARGARARGADLLQPPCVPGVRLQRAAAGTEAFLLQQPLGACPSCDGLGVQEFFDPARVVLHPHLSLAGGAVRGWDRRNDHYFQLIQSLARHYGFDIETPWTELPPHVQHVLLNGSGEEAIEFSYKGEAGRKTRKRHPFEGIVPNLTRRYRETESPMVREELSRYLECAPCPECEGTRLNRAARFVFVGGKSLPELAHLSVGRALEVLGAMQLPGWRGEVAGKIVKSVGERLRFLKDVGLDYLTLDRTRRDALGRGSRSASASRARSAPASRASCTSWMSPRSGCTSATTSACSPRSSSCAISATR